MALSPVDLKQTPATSTLAAAGADGVSKGTSAGLGLAKDFDSFLTLLTTQLKYQDPTAPMDTNQFTQQLVAFTGVEQQVNANKNLETLISLQQGSKFGGSLDYIGRDIEATGGQTAIVDGKAKMSFDIAGSPSTATITIMDAGGKTVASQTIEPKAGSNTVYWDGTTSGGKLTSGTYTYAVTAKNGSGTDLTVKTYTAGTVTGLASDDDGSYLMIGDLKVPTDKVVAVREHKATTAS